MTQPIRKTATVLGPAEVARLLGISIKALRLYESWGLVVPRRTARGWRFYAPEDVERLSRTLALKAMGFGLAQIVGLLDAGPDEMAAALAAQELQLDERRKALDEALEAVRRARRSAGGARLRLVA